MKKIISVFILIMLLPLFCVTSGCGHDNNILTVYAKTEQTERLLKSISKSFYEQYGIRLVITKCEENACVTETDILTSDPPSSKFLDITDRKFTKNLLCTAAALSEDGRIYGIPLKINCYAIAYNKNVLKAPEYIDTLSDFLSVSSETYGSERLNAVFSYCFYNRDTAADLMSLPIYLELCENDDYSDTLTAAANAKQLAFRYYEETERVLSFYKKFSSARTSKQESFDLLNHSGSAVMTVSTDDAELLTAGIIGALPFYTEPLCKNSLLLKNEGVLCIGKNASNESINSALSFFDFLDKNSTELGFMTPFRPQNGKEYKNEFINSTARMLSGGDINVIPVLTPAYPSGFADSIYENIMLYMNGIGDFDQLEQSLKSVWKAGRESNP